MINDDDLVYKINDIFEYIENKLEIALQECFYQRGMNHYLKINVYKKTRFNKKGCRDIHIVPNKNTKYKCKPLLQIQPIYYAQKIKRIFFIILKYE